MIKNLKILKFNQTFVSISNKKKKNILLFAHLTHQRQKSKKLNSLLLLTRKKIKKADAKETEIFYEIDIENLFLFSSIYFYRHIGRYKRSLLNSSTFTEQKKKKKICRSISRHFKTLHKGISIRL